MAVHVCREDILGKEIRGNHEIAVRLANAVPPTAFSGIQAFSRLTGSV